MPTDCIGLTRGNYDELMKKVQKSRTKRIVYQFGCDSFKSIITLRENEMWVKDPEIPHERKVVVLNIDNETRTYSLLGILNKAVVMVDPQLGDGLIEFITSYKHQLREMEPHFTEPGEIKKLYNAFVRAYIYKLPVIFREE